MIIAEQIAKFIVNTNFTDFPRETVDYATKLVLSNLGAMIGGSVEPSAKIFNRRLGQIACRAEAGVVGCGFRTSAENAALANGNQAHATELEDVSFPEGCLSSNVFAACLSLGESVRASGREVIEAVVLGHEVQARLGFLIRGWERGYSGFSLGSLGPAASAIKLLRLDTERATMALSIAASMQSGLSCQAGTMAHFLEAGVGAANGLIATILAKDGFTGRPDFIEGYRGLYNIYCHEGRDENRDLEELIKALGAPFRLMEMVIKKYPCCHLAHRVIDGMIELTQKHKITPDQIDSIEVHVDPYLIETMHYPDPTTTEDTRFSLEHNIAAVLLQGKPSFDTYTNEKAIAPDFSELRRKVHVSVDLERPRSLFEGIVVLNVKLKNGKEYVQECKRARGDAPLLAEEGVMDKAKAAEKYAQWPYLSEAETMDKFRACAEWAQFLSSEQIERIGEMVFGLEKVKDVSRLLEIATFGK